MPVVELNLEHAVGEGLDDLSLQLELFLLCRYRPTSFLTRKSKGESGAVHPPD
jgi:hypothetical protein